MLVVFMPVEEQQYVMAGAVYVIGEVSQLLQGAMV